MKNRLFYVLMLFFCLTIIQPISTATAQITLVGERIQNQQALPGEQYTGSVMVHNETDSVVTIRIYQDEITALTSFDRGDKIITINRSNADWITHASERMTIQSGEVAKVEYQIVVPLQMGIEPPEGTYWSALSVDVVGLGTSAFSKPYSRHHLSEIATHIKDSGTPALAINSMKMKGERHDRKLEAVMINTGNALVKPDVWFELYDTAGNLKERVSGTAGWVFPGDFDRVVADVSHLKGGVYEAQVVIDAGGDHIFGASYTINMTGIGSVADAKAPNLAY
ncbi:MAG: hypothetical protein AB8G77_24910 [Rhodothermales bacterium]